MMTKTSTTAIVTMALSFLMPSCGSEEDPLITEKGNLYGGSPGSLLWNGGQLGVGATIPVCFATATIKYSSGAIDCPNQQNRNQDCLGSSSSVRGDNVIIPFDVDAVRATVRTGVENTWQKAANVEFFGWGDCPVVVDPSRGNTLVTLLSNLVGTMVVNLTNHDDAGIGKNSAEGSIINLNWGPTMSVPPGVPIDLNYAHEFGHSLGFYHEWTRPDYQTPSGCTVDPPGGIS